MFKGIRCETTRTLFTLSTNSAMEGQKANRAGTSKEKFKKQFQPKKQHCQVPYMADNMLIPRVKKYLEEHHSHDMSLVDVDIMVDELRARYPEYSRRKRAPFKQGVRNAYDFVYKTYGVASDMSDWGVTSDMSDISSASDKDADLDEEMERNRPNDQMVSVYLRQPAQQNKSRKRSRSDDGEKELINISSDEEVLKNDGYPQKSQNVPTATITSERIVGPLTQKPVQNNIQIKPTTTVAATPATSATPKKRKKWKEIETRSPTVSFKDFGGSSKALVEICKLLVHIHHPEIYNHIGIAPPRGILLHGPPGCGKTLLAHCIAGEIGIPLMKVAGPELIAGVSGESEERIRDLFDQAAGNAPCILFLDEVDAITPNRRMAEKGMERRIVAQFLSCLDELSQKEGGDLVVVIGATNRPESLDPALRRAGRFDREVCLGIPDKDARIHILHILCKDLKLSTDFEFDYIARNTPGFVGADLMALTREASMVAVNRVFGNLKMRRIGISNESEDKPKDNISEAVDIVDGVSNIDEASSKNPISSSMPASTNEKPKDDKMEVPTDLIKPMSASTNKKPKDDKMEILSDLIKPMSASTNKKPKDNKMEIPSDFIKPMCGLSEEVKELMIWLREDKKPLSNEQLNEIHIELTDFKEALKCVQPSATREGFTTVPDVTWDDIGSLTDIREKLQLTILAPVRYPELFAKLGICTPSGVLLCGPPGCGKTLLAKAVANEAGINFISVKGPELLNMYVGESEKAVRQCFQRARNSAPCVIFFDELDALCPKRSDSGEGGASMRVVNQMLTEMDGMESRKGVFLMAASNRPEIIDPAVLRPGRLDKVLYIGLPTPADRVDILKALTKNGTRPLLDEDVDLKVLGESTECSGYTGADLAALVREAGIEALKEVMRDSCDPKNLIVSNKHFKEALGNICPSVSEKDRKHYEMLRKVYSSKKS